MTAPLRRSGILVATIKKGCESKRRYAEEMAARANGQRLAEQNGIELFIYPCKLCRGWHLTKCKQYRFDWYVNYEYPPTPR